MNHLRDLLQEAINTFLHNPNQFASGGLFLMAIGAVGALLRKIPNNIWTAQAIEAGVDANKLVEAALAVPTHDNVTAILVKLSKGENELS